MASARPALGAGGGLIGAAWADDRAGFLDIAANAPERVRVIDADSTPEAITETVWQAVCYKFDIMNQANPA